MAYFPAFLPLTNQKILVVGGGIVACRKVEKLLLFQPKMRIVTLEVHPELQKLIEDNDIEMDLKSFEITDLQDQFMVIVAVDDLALQQEIFQIAQDRHLFCNCVDSADYCNFLFPALVVRGDLCVGVNTAGKAPAVSSLVRQTIETAIPENVEEIVDSVQEFRMSLPRGKRTMERVMEYSKELFTKSLNQSSSPVKDSGDAEDH
jgi:precorrin-2 dehydrogenase / sirohydrochlorin ferrochelatase